MRKFLRLSISAVFFLFTSQAMAQNVTGTIVAEEDNSPLQGVTVTNRTTNKKTLTNNAGYFSISAESGNILIFFF